MYCLSYEIGISIAWFLMKMVNMHFGSTPVLIEKNARFFGQNFSVVRVRLLMRVFWQFTHWKKVRFLQNSDRFWHQLRFFTKADPDPNKIPRPDSATLPRTSATITCFVYRLYWLPAVRFWAPCSPGGTRTRSIFHKLRSHHGTYIRW